MSSPRLETTLVSRVFIVPAAVLRGFAKVSSPAASRSRFMASKRERGK
jgi:hypothetical protein